ncbi:MAG TPA: SBBP repeat-containing protein [Gaiellales bacterium]|jgi:hypothetical protein|nr:SBBP repeat-containing protein [Gaiellales bacterium]
MRGDKRTLRALAGSAIVTLAVASAITAVQTVGPDGGARAYGAQAPRPKKPVGPERAFAAMPLAFVQNQGQTDARVRYYALGNHYAFFATRDELMLSLTKNKPARQLALALRFIGRNAHSTTTGARRAPGKVNYLRGKDSAKWQTQLARYSDIVYHELWPHIDLRLHQKSGTLKYEFQVHPGARIADIRLAYAGATGLSLDRKGALRIETGLGVLRDSAPVSYQRIAGKRVAVESRYVLKGGDKSRRFAFDVGRHRHDRDLIIDPGIQFTTFLGGGSAETGAGIAVDANGNSYIGGTTQSPDFPTTPGAFKRTGAASNFSDVFVTKLNPAGTALIYSTFVGGSNLEFGNDIAIDAAGNAYVTGTTKSSNFPTTGGAFDRSLNIPPNCPRCTTDNTDGFVFKLNAAGSALTYSTYLGSTDIDSPRGITVDGSGSAYVVGETPGADFPTTAGAFQRTRNSPYDMFVTKLNPTGTALAYSTFLGGSGVDDGQRIAVDAGGNAYALGFTSSTDFPVTAGAFDTTANGGFDTTLTKLNAAGSALVYSTYLGGSDFDSGSDVALDGAGNAYIGGTTSSADFPTTPGAFKRVNDGNDGFVTKLNAAGSAAVYSTLFGGSGTDSASGVALDPSGNAWLSGGTTSADFPVTADAADASFNGGADAIIAELNAAGSAFLYGTFLGGSQSDGASDIGRDSAGNLYVTGSTFSMDFPATTGAFDTIFNGDTSIFWGDAFVTKLSLTGGTTPPAPPPVPTAPTLLAPSNASSPAQPISFDWSDVTGAASYAIQIDDSSAFSAPLVLSDSVTASQYVTGGLAATMQFWRVRGVNTAGVPGAWSATRSFTPQAPPPPTTVTNVDINPATVAGGDSSSGTIIVGAAAPQTTVVALSSSNPAVASVPTSATVPAGQFTATFIITTSAVSSTTTVTITATYNGASKTGTLTVTPAGAPPPGPSLQSLAVSPSSVAGGSGTSGIVTLSSAAPPAGTTVSLTSSNGGVAGVPASVTVPAGATVAGFAISTSAVSSSTSVTISAFSNGITQTASLAVTAAAPPPQSAALTVSATGRSGERVTSSPAGISVASGSSGSASFAVGTSITLSVSNGRSTIWSGACSSGGSKVRTCTFTLNGAASVTANIQ